jgi:hypothetical protein
LTESVTSAVAAWESFYVIVGSSAAALTGLQFVVITLAMERRSAKAPAIAAFATPTVVHFGAAFLVSVLFSAPWESIASPAIAVGVMGLLGLGYIGIVFRRAKRQSDYRPVFEDWLWHTLLPLGAYLGFAVAGLFLQGRSTGSEFAIGAAAVLLLIAGIHNAWDAVTYNALLTVDEKPAPDEPRDTG